MRDLFSEGPFRPRISHVEWQQSVVESQGGGPGGQKPASYPKNDKNGTSKGGYGNEYYPPGETQTHFGHDKPKGNGDFDSGGTIYQGKYKPPDKVRKYKLPRYNTMSP